MANELTLGQPRLGFFYDGLPETPHVAIELLRTEESIEMRLPWNQDHNPEHERWFTTGVVWGDDPDQTKFSYSLPAQVEFIDPSGPVALVGCRAVGHRSNLGYGVGIGRADVKFAVLGASDAASYAEINGLRSEIEGLGAFSGTSSVNVGHEVDADGRLAQATIRLKAPPPRAVSRSHLNLQFRPSYSSGPADRPGETLVRDRTLLQTHVRDPRGWDVHLSVHFAVRDLLRLAAWRKLDFTYHGATRDDDPMRMLDGSAKGIQWHQVETSLTDLSREPLNLSSLQFELLFRFDDIRSRGMHRWLVLHQEHPRIVQPFLRLLELRDATLETHVAQLGMGLEALGLQIARAERIPSAKANWESIEARIARVASTVQRRLPFDGNAAARQIASAYNGVKHANRDLPTNDQLLMAYRKGIQIFRVWVMATIGVPMSRAREQIERDRLTRAIDA